MNTLSKLNQNMTLAVSTPSGQTCGTQPPRFDAFWANTLHPTTPFRCLLGTHAVSVPSGQTCRTQPTRFGACWANMWHQTTPFRCLLGKHVGDDGSEVRDWSAATAGGRRLLHWLACRWLPCWLVCRWLALEGGGGSPSGMTSTRLTSTPTLTVTNTLLKT